MHKAERAWSLFINTVKNRSTAQKLAGVMPADIHAKKSAGSDSMKIFQVVCDLFYLVQQVNLYTHIHVSELT